ncbi:MAG: AMP-binding protein [Lachnospiraceae bacterium]|nr:AMP-binding protein [Lachnospiraceae bacterium]
MNYMDMIRQQDHSHLALIEDGREYSYGDLVALSEQTSRDTAVFSPDLVSGRIHWIRKTKISEQLIEFLAANERGKIPIIVPIDRKMKSQNADRLTDSPSAFWNQEQMLLEQEQKLWDQDICMGVMTSGSTGEPKVLFRSYESWADYFNTQNLIFGINQDSRLFAQGSLAFTGNLNMYLAAFSAGAAVIAQNAFRPWEWQAWIEAYQVNAIYLIPSKLMCFPRVLAGNYSDVKTIVSGSQGMNRADAVQLKNIFPEARITLYYGASELSYITYITEEEMTDDRGLVGRPFPGVQVAVRDQQIYVTTPCCAAGVECPCTVSDQGYLDEMGRLHFTGRSDDIVNVHGRKVSLWRIEKVLLEQPEIHMAVVLNLPGQKTCHKEQETGFTALQGDGDFATCRGEREIRVAFLVLQDDMRGDSSVPMDQYTDGGCLERDEAFRKRLRQTLAGYEMPGRFIVLPEMPYRENGKVDTEKLQEIWRKRGTV